MVEVKIKMKKVYLVFERGVNIDCPPILIAIFSNRREAEKCAKEINENSLLKCWVEEWKVYDNVKEKEM